MHVKYQNYARTCFFYLVTYTYCSKRYNSGCTLLLLKSFFKKFKETEIIRDIIYLERKSFHTHIYINFSHRSNNRDGKYSTSISKHFVYSTYLRFILSRFVREAGLILKLARYIARFFRRQPISACDPMLKYMHARKTVAGPSPVRDCPSCVIAPHDDRCAREKER